MKLNVEEMNSNAEVQAESVAAEKPVRRRAPRRASAAAGAPAEAAVPAAEAPAAEAPAAEAAEAPAEAPKKRVSRSRKKVVDEAAEAPAADAAAAEAPAAEIAAEAPAEAPKKRVSRSRKKVAGEAAEAPAAETPEAATAAPAAEAPAETVAEAPAPATRSRRASSPVRDASEAAKAEPAAVENTDAPAAENGGAVADKPAKGEQAEAGAKNDGAKNDGAKNDGAKSEGAKNDGADGERGGRTRGRRTRSQKAESGDAVENTDGQDAAKSQSDDAANQQDRGSRGNGGGAAAESPRSSRTRQRDRKRRGQNDDVDPEITEDDVLLPIAGILDVLDNYAFVRTSGYLPGTSDVYVSLGQVKKYGMRRGDAVVGAIRQPREGEGSGRQKYNAIVRVESVNGRAIDENEKRADIAELTPIHPQDRLSLGQGKAGLGSDIDRVAPVALGQRAVLSVPATIPAERILAGFADAVSAAKPDAHLMLVLTETRPEDVTELERTVRGEVITATFERTAEDQSTIAELAVDRARRLVELGHDVVVLLDSLNDFAHATVQAQQGGRTSTETAQAHAIAQVKRLVGAARNIENGGSLTLVATARTKTGDAFDKALLKAVAPVANTFVKVAGSRFAPEIVEDASYTLGSLK
ncbi:hypothetical protein [Leucobacter sp. gxy201]|uniref:hypothetical protein n=1 Tax=Leucobacter sp. gxy201 TaxID=2957200 RepID=UPI003DA163A0